MRSPVFSPLVSQVRRAVTLSSILPRLNRRACAVLTTLAAALLLNGGEANAQTTFTCSAQSGTNCALSVGASQSTASTSSFNVPTAGTISSISIQLHGVWADGVNGYSMGAAEFLLTGPGGKFDLLGETGDTVDGADDGGPNSGLHGLNIVIQDGANPAPMACGGVCSGTETNNWPEGNGSSVGNAGTTTVTVKPGSYFGYDPSNGNNPPLLGVLGDWPDTDGCNPDPIIGNSGTYNNAAFCSAPTLTTHYGSTTANGTWTLTLQTVSGFPTAISITDWSVTITYATATPTTTAISSNANPSNSSNTVTFTATVTSTGGTPTGTVAFTANGATIAGCGANVLSGGQTTCTTTLGQGNNGIEASYTPGGSFGASNATINQLVEATPTQSGNTWCNSGQITAPGNSAGIQYPSVIHVSGYPAGATVGGNLTVELLNATGPAGVNAYHLLVSPAGQNLDFFDSTFAYQQPSSPVNLTIFDDAGQTPSGSSAPSTGNYDPYDHNQNGVADDTFPSSTSPSIDSNIPQVPVTINRANPLGGTSFTNFQQAFSGAPANGDWALYTYAGGGESEAIQGGWCVTLDMNTGVGTTTTVTATPNPQATGQQATITATVLTQGSNTPVTSGTVTFLDNNAVPAGVTNNTVSLDGNGHAQIATSSLAEGDHPITATYNGTSADNGSYGNVVQRINDGTTIYAANATISNGPSCGAAYCYCNGGPVSTTATYKGAFTPNPSILTVTDLPGTINTVTLGLNQYSSAPDILYSLESMVVNPTGADLDFFSNAGFSSGGGTASLGNYLFSDAAGSTIPISVSTLTPGTYKPSSYPEEDSNWPEPAQPYFLSSSGFYTLPSGITYATSRGSGTFVSQFGNTDPNGVWALYMTEDDPAGAASAAYGWCVNFTENPVTVSVDLSHQGTGTGTDFVQGENGAQITTLVQASNTTGPTGDPLGTNPLQVVDTLPAGLTYQSASGTGWSCSASGQTITCTNDEAIAQGGSYPTLTLNVNVSSGASASIGNGVTVTGAGITGNTGSDTITVDPGTTLAVSKSHTGNFTTGATGQWTIVVSNTAAGGATSGTVNVSDTLPTGYTLASYSSTSSLWTCNGASNVVTCSATPGIAGGSSSTINLTVNVPSNSPSPVSNTALAWGGGDVVHNSQGSAAQGADPVPTIVDAAPAITSAGSTTFTVGSAGSFTVTTTGNPTASLSKTGSLPSGVTFIDNGDGTGTLAGTPSAGSGGTYPITITAANGIGSNATQSFTLTVDQAPAITSGGSTTFTVGSAGSFTVTASGFPAPTFTKTGSLPTGVSLSTSGVLSGTPAAGTGGTYPLTIIAANGIGTNATQSFTLTVDGPPAITSAGSSTFTVGSAGSFTVTTTGNPTASLSKTGSLPTGVAFIDNGNGTGTLAGTPSAGSGGTYPITITASNGIGTNATQSFTLTVDQAPAITSGGSTTLTVGSAGSFTVTTTGNPTASLSKTGSLPTGVTFIDNGNGTGTLSGTPAAGSSGTYHLTITAANGVGANASQSFTLTVHGPPAITSGAGATFTVGIPGSFTVTTTGKPAPSLNESGTLPNGVTFTDNGNGTATLAGTPADHWGGAYSITITASNGIGTNATQSFTLTVDESPYFSSAASASIIAGAVGNYTIGAGGYPIPSLSESGALPTGVTFQDNGDGTATLGGVPATGSAGIYPLTITASNIIAPNATQPFTLTVVAPPAYVVTMAADDTTATPANCPIPSAGSSCTLRDALAAASNAGAGNITFSTAAFNASNTPAQNTITLGQGGTLMIPTATTITGPVTGTGASLTNLVTIDGGGASNNFPVFTTTSSAINDGIQNLVITDGGDSGIYNGYAAALTVQNSTISGNSSTIGASGIFNNYNANLTITGSTISGNSGLYGAIVNEAGGSVTVTESTISGNTASNNGGGGILSGGSVTVSNSTITGNSAYTGGGIRLTGGTLTLTDSIVAGNTAQTIDPDINGAATDGGNNLIGDGTGLTGITNGTNGDQVGTSASPLNPLLAPLDIYGGPTKTMVPLPSSPAICAISPSSAQGNDQRGLPRFTTYNSTTCQDAGAVQSNYSLSFSTEPISPEGSGVAFPVAITLNESGNTFTAASESIPVTLSSGATLSGSPVSSSTSAGVANYSLTITNPTPVTGLMLTAALTLNSPIAVSANSTSFDLVELNPVVSALSPTNGPNAGGTTVTITGTNFTAATSVKFGGVAATAFTVVTSSMITATSPAGTGTVDVTVTTPISTSATSAADQFTFVAPPAVTGISPTAGPVAGGTAVTITGTNFNNATDVRFGSTSSTSFTVLSPTSISATSPAGTGTVDVTVTTVGGTSATTAADQFFYIVSATTTASPISAAAGTAFSGRVATFTDNAGEIYRAGEFTATIDWGDGTTSSGTIAQPGGVGTAYTVRGNHTYAIGGSYTFTVTVTPALGSPAPGTNTATVSQVPAITSTSSATFTVGTAGSFTVTASGYPAPTFSKTGALPTGVTLSSGGVLSGTPAAGTGSVYTFTITANNGNSPNATQVFTLTVDQAPAVTSAASASFTAGTAGNFHVTSSGYPTATLTETGSLPGGVTFIDNGNGTAFLAGTPASGTGGSYSITIQAANGISPNAQQSFTLTVDQAPAITSASGATFNTGSPGTFTLTTTGFPAPTLTETGALPSGVTFIDNGNGTATLAGTPADGGVFPITITAANGFGTNATQSFTLSVNYQIAVTANPISPVAEAPYTSIVGSFIVANNRATLVTFSTTIDWGDGTISTGIITQPGGPGTAYLVTGTHTYAASGTFGFTVSVTPTLGPVATGSSTATVAPAPATHFMVTAPATANVGGAFNFTVTALDALNNPTIGYYGVAHFTSTDPVAVLPADATLVNGMGTFAATLMTVGSQTITATDTTVSSLAGTSGAIAVTIPSFVVENTDDSGPGSLRAVLADAASAGSGNITFDPTAFATAQTITLTSGSLNIPSNTTITGPTTGGGASLTNLVTVDGGGASSNFSIFTVNSGVTGAAISNLIITDGYINSQGGAIANAGALTVTNCTLSNNYAGGYATGGGNGGGAIYNDGALTIQGSTFSGNMSAPGGAIQANSGSVTISNSTFSGNSVSDNKAGSAIYINTAAVTLNSSTLSGNPSTNAFAIFNNGTLAATNTIIAGNIGGDCDAAGAGTCPTNGSSGNVVGVSSVNLAPLGNYGGPMQTMIPLPGSPAICAINPSAATGADQRGFPRTTTYGATTCQDSGSAETNYALSFTTEPAATEDSGQAFPAAITLSESGNAFTAASESIPVTLSGSATLAGSPVSASTSAGMANYSLTVTNPTAAAALQLMASLTLNGPAAVTATSSTFSLNPPIATTTMVASNLTVPWSANSQNVTLVVNVTASGNTVNSGALTIFRFVSVTTLSGTTYQIVPVTVPFTGSPATFTLSLPAGLTVGTYTLPVSYSDPNDVFAPSSDSSHTLTVGHAATTTTASNASATYSATAQNVTLSATVTSLEGTVNAGTVTFTMLQGSTPVGTAVTSGTISNGTASASYTLPAATTAGTYTIQAVYNGTANFATSSDSSHTLTVNSAATTTASSNATVTYSASAQSVTLAATVTSPSGSVNSGAVTFSVLQGGTPVGTAVTSSTVSSGSASVSYTVPAGTAAGTYTIQAVYSGTSSLQTSSDSTHTLTVNTAATTTTASNATATFSATAQSVTLAAAITSPSGPVNSGTVTFTVLQGSSPVGTAMTSAAVSNGAASVSYTLPAGTAAGIYTIQAVFSGTASLLTSNDSAHTLTIGKATATVMLGNLTQTYTGSPISITATTTPPGLTVNITYSSSPNPPTTAGSYTVVGTISNANYMGTATGTLKIAQATPSVTWATPAAITYGTALSSTQLDAAASFNGNSLAGTFVYSPAAGTVLTAGPHMLSATFTPTDITDYTTATQTVQINVNSATPSITWATPAAITYGTALSSTQLDASASFHGNSVAGTFAYSPAAGAVLATGPHTLSATFTPADTTDYTTATQSTTITITGAVLTITANNATRVYGTANPAFTGSVTGQQNGDTFTESFTTAATISSPVNSYAIVPSVTGANLADYTQSVADGTLAITKAGSTITLGTSSGSITPGQSVTLTAQVSSDTTGTPTGTVSFYDGTVLLKTAPIAAGVASYSTAALAPGITHALTATYNGDTNFNSSSSTSSVTVVVAPLNFTMTLFGPSTATVVPGGSFTYQVTVTPDYGVYSGTVNFAVEGLPPGATATFSPSSIAANGGPQTITITIQTAPVTAMQQSSPPATGRHLAPYALAFLLLFGVGTMRKRGRALRRMVAVALLLAGGAAATLLSGCGGKNGFFAQQPQSYAITITATSTTIQQSVTVNLNVE